MSDQLTELNAAKVGRTLTFDETRPAAGPVVAVCEAAQRKPHPSLPDLKGTKWGLHHEEPLGEPNDRLEAYMTIRTVVSTIDVGTSFTLNTSGARDARDGEAGSNRARLPRS